MLTIFNYVQYDLKEKNPSYHEEITLLRISLLAIPKIILNSPYFSNRIIFLTVI